MDRLRHVSPDEWLNDPTGPVRVSAVIFADEALIDAMDDKVAEQISNVAACPGLLKPSPRCRTPVGTLQLGAKRSSCWPTRHSDWVARRPLNAGRPH